MTADGRAAFQTVLRQPGRPHPGLCLAVALVERRYEALEETEFTIRRSRVEQIVGSQLAPEDAGALNRFLFGIAGAFRHRNLTAEEALDGLERALSRQGNGDPDLEEFRARRPILTKLLQSKSVVFAAKALDISYDFERVYVAGRVLTSIRPVFDDQREEMLGTTIVQTLRIEYVSIGGDQSSLSIALDLEDVTALQKECARAIQKAKSARDKTERDCDVNAIIPGEEIR